MSVKREEVLKYLEEANMIEISELVKLKKVSTKSMLSDLNKLQKSGSVNIENKTVSLTEMGMDLAISVVRNHRLWELYLTNEADYAADHVHDDAEKVEHLLSEEKVRELELFLDYPTVDPHGKPIPERGQL